MICLSLTGSSLRECLEQLLRHRAGVDAAEVRADLLTEQERSRVGSFPGMAARAGCSLPLVCTARRINDGGSWDGTETERLALLEAAAGAGYRYLDLEADLRGSERAGQIAARAAAAGCAVIRSARLAGGPAGGLPDNPAALLRDLAGEREVARLAVTPGATADLVRLLEAADNARDIRKVIEAEGPYGLPVLVLARRFGSMMAVTREPEALADLYRCNRIGDRTRFFGIIGSPIAHSRSPEYHNRRFAEDGLDACYLPFLVDDVDAFFALADLLPLQAFSVTLPHKEAVFARAPHRDAGSTAARAANTMVRGPDGWIAVNTDVPGFLAPLRNRCPEGVAGRGATVIGAGGAARAVVLALLREGSRVLGANRTVDRARRLVREIVPLAAGQGAPSEASAAAAALAPETDLSDYRDLLVNTTSMGMHGEGDPLPWVSFTGDELVYDAVYTPPDTPFVLRARAAGCVTITGDEMFAAQADAQYRLFSRLACGGTVSLEDA